jgi:hypothetical protein
MRQKRRRSCDTDGGRNYDSETAWSAAHMALIVSRLPENEPMRASCTAASSSTVSGRRKRRS